MTANPLEPSIALLAKLGSIIVHLDEGNSADGHHFDVVAMMQLARDPEVQQWIEAMGKMSLVPLKRKG